MDPQAIHKSKFWTTLHISSEHQLNMYLATIIKTILHPNYELEQLITSERKTKDSRLFSVGIQLRMNTADRKDCGIRYSNVSHYLKVIDGIVKSMGYSSTQTTLYISTDLPEVIDFIRNETKGYNIIESTLFDHGHTSSAFSQGKPFKEVAKKVMADFINIVRCDIAFVTWKSSLARLMCFAMYPKPCKAIEKL